MVSVVGQGDESVRSCGVAVIQEQVYKIIKELIPNERELKSHNIE